MRHGQGDKGFFPLGQLALGKNGSIVVKEFFGQLRGPFGYFGKLRQVLGVVIGIHRVVPHCIYSEYS